MPLFFEGEIENDDKELFSKELKECDLLFELFPYLLHHRLLGIFYSLILKYDMIYCISKEMWKATNKILVYENLKSREYYMEAKHLCDLLEREDISYAIIKGLHLNSFLYDKNSEYFFQRSFNDIDILVNRKDITNLDKILKGMNYFNGDYEPESNSLRCFSRKEAVYYLMATHETPQYIKASKFSCFNVGDIMIIDVNYSIFEGGKKLDPKQDIEDRIGTPIPAPTIAAMYPFIFDSIKDPGLSTLLGVDFSGGIILFNQFLYQIKKENNEDLILCNLVDIYRLIKYQKKQINSDKLNYIIRKANLDREIKHVSKLLKHWGNLSLIDTYFSL